MAVLFASDQRPHRQVRQDVFQEDKPDVTVFISTIQCGPFHREYTR